MIGLVFLDGNEVVEVRVEGHSIYFRTSTYGAQFVPLKLFRFPEERVIKEFPDLEGNKNYADIAMNRLLEHIKSLGSENRVAEYIIEELRKYGYVPKFKQKQGFRVEAIL